MIDTALYYNPQKLLSYDRILNFVIGARGIGKSYAFKRHPINRFLKHGEQFIYLRRYKPELKKIGNYFNDIQEAFPDHQFKVKGRELYIDGKIAGWAIPLSTWQSEKSNAYPNVTSIIYDEFIREKDNSGYLPNEVEALLNLMDTVFRGRDNVRCFCLSNAVSVVNPYFVYFGIIPDIGKRFNAYSNFVVEIPDSVDFSEERRKTKFGRLIDGTEYGAMSLDNEFVNDSSIFIQKRTPASRFQFSVTFKGMVMGVWVDRNEGIMFLSNDHDPSTKHHYVLSQDDMKENTLLISGWKTHFHLRKLGFAFKNGYLRFDNQVLRTTGYELFKKMNV